ncbi:RNA-directed DNA polymerase, eukaryota, reverse transcriptase zinc-binding domain protein [Tanacetum coccineum]
MVVQKWDPSINLDRTEPCSLPLWIKLMNPPLEAWITKGLSALASRIGKPLIMDAMTTKMCNQGIGRLGYARVLVEVNAKKDLKDHIDVLYRNSNSGKDRGQILEHAKANENMNNVEGRQVNEGKMVIKDVRSTSNTYAILQDMEEDFVLAKLNTKEKEEVEKYVIMNLQPSLSATRKWSKEMKEYFKGKWKRQQSKEKENVEVGTDDDTDIELDENGVYIDKSGTTRFMTDNEVSGMGSDLLTKLLETHMKKNRIDKDNNHVNCTLMNSTEQSMLYMVEVLNPKIYLYCTFIYAANKGKDRRELWKELNLNKRIVRNSAWIIMRDVNVSLNLEDHSEGTSHFTQDMIEFQECINEIRMEDLNCSGLHFTWTKSLLNPNATVLKKIDGVMGYNLFLTKFNNDHALFLPYGISDHSPAILKIPQVLTKKNKSFRPANYITDKEEFKLIHSVQVKINEDPTSKVLRDEGIGAALSEYKEAVLDEEKLLRQKTKITWLNEGDKNSAYFYIVLKGRLNRNKIMSICAEDGERYDNCDVAEQFVKHLQGFLGISPEVTKLKDTNGLMFEKKASVEEAH